MSVESEDRGRLHQKETGWFTFHANVDVKMRKESINDEISLFSGDEMMVAKDEEPQYFAREISIVKSLFC